MKILIDTNVILDVLIDRKEFVEDAVKVLKLCEIKRVEGYVSAMTFPNLVYIMRKQLKREEVKEVVERLCLLLFVAELQAEDIRRAAALEIADYEDALQCAQAMRIKADFIITRNIKDFKNSAVPALTPGAFLSRFFGAVS